MSDLLRLELDEILDVLTALGDALDFDRNTHLQEAYEASLVANVLPAAMVQEQATGFLRPLFFRDNVTEIAETQVGLAYLNGWVPRHCTTAANYGCAPSDPECCIFRPATADWSRR